MKAPALIFSFVLFSGLVHAQQKSSFNFSHDHIALSVSDVNRSAEFYMNVLQLPEISNRSKIEGVRWFLFSDNLELHLISAIKEKVTINKAVHLALKTPDSDDFVRSLEVKRFLIQIGREILRKSISERMASNRFFFRTLMATGLKLTA